MNTAPELDPREIEIHSDSPGADDELEQSLSLDGAVSFRQSLHAELGKICLVVFLLLFLRSGYLERSVYELFRWSGNDTPAGVHIAVLLTFLLCASLVLVIAYKHLDRVYVIDNDSVVDISGLCVFARRARRVFHHRIFSVEVDQSAWHRLFNVGDVLFMSGVSGGVPELVFRGVRNPQLIRQLVQERIRNVVHDKAANS